MPRRWISRAALRDRVERAATARAVATAQPVTLYRVQGGYEARDHDAEPPHGSHAVLGTIHPPKSKAAKVKAS